MCLLFRVRLFRSPARSVYLYLHTAAGCGTGEAGVGEKTKIKKVEAVQKERMLDQDETEFER